MLLAVCFVAFWVCLGRIGLVDPDEPFYTLTAIEMLERHDWITPHIFGAPQFEKPILYFWLTMGSFKLFGVSELAARAVPALFGTLLVLQVQQFGRRLFRPRSGFLAAIVFTTTLASIAMCRTVLTDVVFAYFVVGALLSYWCASEEPARRGRWVLLHFAASGLAVLTKGPVGSLVVWMAIGAHRLVTRRRTPLHGAPLGWGLALYAAIAVPWFVVMLSKFGWEYFQAFFVHENLERLIRAEHPSSNHWYFYLMILSLGSLPWMPLLAVALLRLRSSARTSGHAFLFCWLLTSLLFFTAAQSKLASYAYFLFVPLALWMGDTLDRALQEGVWRPRERWVALTVALLQIGVLVMGLLPRDEVAGGPLAYGLITMSALSALGVALSLRGPSRAGVAATAAGVVALTLFVVGPGAASLGSLISVRAEAQRLVASEPTGLPVVTEKLLVRGAAWYTRRPVAVLASDPQPFWTSQNVEVLVNRRDVQRYLARDGAAMCILRPQTKEWKLASQGGTLQVVDPRRVEPEEGSLAGEDEALHDQDRYFGHKVVARLAASGRKSKPGAGSASDD